MSTAYNRRNFIVATIGLGMGSKTLFAAKDMRAGPGKRVGMIGLDTSHSIAFTKLLNDDAAAPEYRGYKVVAAYPQGSKDIKSSAERIPGYTEEAKKLGVEICGSIDELLGKTDVILLETNDGRLHLGQALPVLKAGKRMFIDKPVAASLKDAIAIYAAAKKYNVPVFSSSSLRYTKSAQEIASGKLIGKVLGAETYSPCKLEPTHPDLFWYGIHGVELMYTVMGRGCKKVVRVQTADTDLVAGTWEDGRIGTFRGLRAGKTDYGGRAFGENKIADIGGYEGYNALVMQIVDFFNTGKPPVSPEETIEIFAFMEAADESKRRGGVPVTLDEVLRKTGLKSG